MAGALTLVLAIVGVLLVKEPLRSSRPVGAGLDMKQSTGDQLVWARLWEDPVAAVERAIREKGSPNAASLAEAPLAKRLRPLRQAIVERVKSGQRLTVLLTTMSGGLYVESTESWLRDRYVLGTTRGVACYAPEGESHLSFIDVPVARAGLSGDGQGRVRARCRQAQVGAAECLFAAGGHLQSYRSPQFLSLSSFAG